MGKIFLACGKENVQLQVSSKFITDKIYNLKKYLSRLSFVEQKEFFGVFI